VEGGGWVGGHGGERALFCRRCFDNNDRHLRPLAARHERHSLAKNNSNNWYRHILFKEDIAYHQILHSAKRGFVRRI
jgi:hypothetical protein